MRQREYEIGRAKLRRTKRKRFMQAVILINVNDEDLLYAQKMYRKVHRDVQQIQRCSQHISSSTLSYSIFSEELAQL